MHRSGKLELENRVVLVTGGGRGIGKTTCLALAREGADLVITARTENEINNTRSMVENLGRHAIAVTADVRDESQVKELFLEAVTHFGKLDILVNNAGLAVRKPISETTVEEYENIMDTNAKGVFMCIKYALPHILKSNNGRIINISSGAGKGGIPRLSAYCASKFAVIGITESVAYEVPGNVKVYAVCPGGTDTGLYRSMFSDIPSLKPEYIADRIVELCMPGSNVPSGSSVEVYY